jgi:hypothetical protein
LTEIKTWRFHDKSKKNQQMLKKLSLAVQQVLLENGRHPTENHKRVNLQDNQQHTSKALD